MDGNRRDSGCRPFFAHAVIRNMSGERRVFTDECDESTTCPVEGGFSRISDSNDRVTQNDQLVRRKAGFHGRSCLPALPLHAGDDLHDEKKQGRAAVGK